METTLFWAHKNRLETIDTDYGFSLFSAGHLAWLVGIAVFAVLIAVIYCKCDLKRRENIRKVMAVGVVLLEALKMCVMGLSHLDISEYLPIHLCSVGGLFILIDALWPNSRITHQLFLYAFTAGALMALICSSATIYPFWNFYSIHIFFFHGYLLVYPIMRLAAGEFKPTYYGVWISIAAVFLLGIPIFFIDGIFDVNYMFLGHPSDVSFLIAIWELCSPIGGRLLYALALAAVGVACMHLLYICYRIPTILRWAGKKLKKHNA